MTTTYKFPPQVWDGALVPIGEALTYPCQAHQALQNATTDKRQADTEVNVTCGEDGEFLYPDPWPMCVETVHCGEPPLPPVDGLRIWSREPDDSYQVSVAYHCVNGSRFDIDNDGRGNWRKVTTKCRWNKLWTPYVPLPACLITHCVDPYTPPEDSFLEEVTSDWTWINEDKWYQCQDQNATGHTRFFESDRDQTNFSMTCQG